MGYLLGIDVGSSSVKAALLDAQTGSGIASASSPAEELPILAPSPGFAEQDPETWWEHSTRAVRAAIEKSGIDGDDVSAIGIAYQMHGLVLVDKENTPVRPSIIWCDSRAVETGTAAAQALGEQFCLERLLNLPGNFTASKLRWVREHEPELYARARHMLLPGDYLALRLTGEATTTLSGLSEGTLWDFSAEAPANWLLEHYDCDPALLAPQVPTFGTQGTLCPEAARALGLKAGTPLTYRAGDQPNNAWSLGVLEPGEAATTAGTSGVVYAVGETRSYDPASRVNIFAHVNHSAQTPRLGTLLCLNGTGILNSWLRRMLGKRFSYAEMNTMAAEVPIGAEGLSMLPYGNGAERSLGNRTPGGLIHGLDFNRHDERHLARAAQEGIVFALAQGMEIMREIGIEIKTIRAGKANMFLSPLFCEAFATVTGATVQLYETDGAAGAARGAGYGAGIYTSPQQTFASLECIETIEATPANKEAWAAAYGHWQRILQSQEQS